MIPEPTIEELKEQLRRCRDQFFVPQISSPETSLKDAYRLIEHRLTVIAQEKDRPTRERGQATEAIRRLRKVQRLL